MKLRNIIKIVVVVMIIVFLAWAPWVTNDYAVNKVVEKLGGPEARLFILVKMCSEGYT
jgi:hypothetical protein